MLFTILSGLGEECAMLELKSGLSGSFSRRNILKAGAAIGASLALPNLVVRASRAGETGGAMIWGKSIEVTMLDPHTALVGSAWQLQYLVYETLVSMGDNFDVKPGIAESWEIPSPTVYVFHLREGVTFSNGRPMTAADVVGSIGRVVDPKFGSWWACQMGSVKSVTALDAKTIKIELNEPFTPLLSSLAASMTAILPMEDLNAKRFDPSKELLGSGPFMVTEHQQNDYWTLVRNPHYWRKGFPKLDKLTIRIITDDGARLAQLRSGAIDIANFENPDAPKLMEAIANVKTVIQQTGDLYTLALNPVWENSPFRDRRLRQAVNLSIDRQQIRDVALSGQGTVSGVAAAVFKDGCAPTVARDVAKAKQLVEAAGGLSFEMVVQSAQAIQQIAQVIQANVAEAGIKAELKIVDEGVFVNAVFVTGQFQSSPFFWSAYADPGMVPAWWEPSVSGFTGKYVVSVPELDQLIRAERRTSEGLERANQLKRICELVDDGAQMIPLVTKPVTVGYRSDRIMAMIQPNEGYNGTLRRIAEFSRV
jgi:peptide/nickel transport system substrate-binding protein